MNEWLNEWLNEWMSEWVEKWLFLNLIPRQAHCRDNIVPLGDKGGGVENVLKGLETYLNVSY